MKRWLLAIALIPLVWTTTAPACADAVRLNAFLPAGFTMHDWVEIVSQQKPDLIRAIADLTSFLDAEGTRENTGGLIPLSVVQVDRVLSQDWRTRYSKVVLDPAGHLAGILLSNSERSSARVYKLGVVPTHRGKNLATVMLAATALRIRERERKEILLNVFSNNAPALTLYKSLGFTVLTTHPSIKPPADVHELQVRVADLIPLAFSKLAAKTNPEAQP